MADAAKKSKSLIKTLKDAFTGADYHSEGQMPIDSDYTLSGGMANEIIKQQAGANDTKGLGEIYQPDKLPESRLARYSVFEEMAEDSTVYIAISQHTANVLTPKADTNEAISIETANNGSDDLVAELNNDLGHLINSNIENWANTAAHFGIAHCRPYCVEGLGVQSILFNEHTHPANIKMYYRAGQLAGYRDIQLLQHYEKEGKSEGQTDLIAPWKLVSFKIPRYLPSSILPPVSTMTGQPFDLNNDNIHESLNIALETRDYGTSLLAAAYDPWCKVNRGIDRMMMARDLAGTIQQVMAMSTGNMDATNAGQYLHLIASQLKKEKEELERKARAVGGTSSFMRSILPSPGDRNGLQIDTQIIDANIQHIEDIMFNIKRFCGALGTDPSLLGFGDMLSGGLGEGGYYRMSLMSSLISGSIRKALANGLDDLIRLHLMFKYRRIYTRSEQPWRVIFNSAANAQAKEEAENAYSRIEYSMAMMGLIDAVDPNGTIFNREKVANAIFTDHLKQDERKVKEWMSGMKNQPDTDSPEESAILEAVKHMDRAYITAERSGRPLTRDDVEQIANQQIINILETLQLAA